MTARAMASKLPATPGVYRFRDERGRSLYIGRAVDLRRRVGSYWGDLRDRWHLRRMVPKIAAVEAVECASAHEAAWLERNLLERAKPYWNRVRGGQEVPVHIRISATGLRVVHAGQLTEDGQDFGPYLGGLRVRQAVSALDRVLPLAYAGSRLSGSERDMARVRGVGAGDRDEITAAIIRVLERDPVACQEVRAELEQRRDAAAQKLSFEHAAKIQEEIEALDWVIAPQRVTRTNGESATVHGWAEGVLVRFEVRAGRVDSWTQRPCDAATASAAVAKTPSQWQPFAAGAAELAARLAGGRSAAS